MVAFILILVGAIDWGLVGLFQFDLVAAIFGGSGATVCRIIHVVGVAGLYGLTFFGKLGKDEARRPRGPSPFHRTNAMSGADHSR